MNGIKGIDATTVALQLRSIIICEFLNEYNKLEKIIRRVFNRNVPDLPQKVLQQLYFYYGGQIGTYIEYETESLKLLNVSYKEQEDFKSLRINQIIKIFKHNPCLREFNFTINSIRYSTNVISFYDCMTCLINMRNILAHEILNLNFKTKDTIDLLSYEQIAKEPFDLLQDYDASRMDSETLHIASNIIYMRKIICKLNGDVNDIQDCSIEG